MEALSPPDDRNAPAKLAARFFHDPDIPNTQVVYSTMCELIAHRRLADGSHLPSIAQVAEAMDCATYPVARAYARLAADGVIACKRRSSTAVGSLVRAQEIVSRKILAGAIAASRDLGIEVADLHRLATIEVDRAYRPHERRRFAAPASALR